MKPNPNFNRALSITAAFYEVDPDEVLGHCRRAELVRCRELISYYLYDRCHMRCDEIAPLLNRHRTSILHSIRAAMDGLHLYVDYRAAWQWLCDEMDKPQDLCG